MDRLCLLAGLTASFSNDMDEVILHNILVATGAYKYVSEPTRCTSTTNVQALNCSHQIDTYFWNWSFSAYPGPVS